MPRSATTAPSPSRSRCRRSGSRTERPGGETRRAVVVRGDMSACSRTAVCPSRGCALSGATARFAPASFSPLLGVARSMSAAILLMVWASVERSLQPLRRPGSVSLARTLPLKRDAHQARIGAEDICRCGCRRLRNCNPHRSDRRARSTPAGTRRSSLTSWSQVRAGFLRGAGRTSGSVPSGMTA
jgi:hypothetical protein